MDPEIISIKLILNLQAIAFVGVAEALMCVVYEGDIARE